MVSSARTLSAVETIGTAPPVPSRLPFLGMLRGLAAQVIVLHHLAFYGPLSDIAYPLAPALIDALFDYGRFAVQIFFVIGGFLTARSIANHEVLDLKTLATIIVRRYQRTGFPYLVTLMIAVGANALADRWMDHESISLPPTIGSALAHVFFLQDVLDYPAITAGVWYLAIDFQLVLLTYLVAAASLWLARRLRQFGPVRALVLMQAVFGALAIASLFWLNRDPELDMWALYFFGSYFLGMALHWTLARELPRPLFWAYAALVGAALAVDWRPRLLVALGVTLLIFAMAKLRLLDRWPKSRIVEYLGRTSFSLFLIHFPVCLVVNAWLSRWQLTPAGAMWGMLAAYLLSQIAGAGFYQAVEAPCLNLRRRQTT